MNVLRNLSFAVDESAIAESQRMYNADDLPILELEGPHSYRRVLLEPVLTLL